MPLNKLIIHTIRETLNVERYWMRWLKVNNGWVCVFFGLLLLFRAGIILGILRILWNLFFLIIRLCLSKKPAYILILVPLTVMIGIFLKESFLRNLPTSDYQLFLRMPMYFFIERAWGIFGPFVCLSHSLFFLVAFKIRNQETHIHTHTEPRARKHVHAHKEIF